MNANTPKNFAIQLGSLITLYISITSLLLLLFGLINLQFPDELRYYFTDEGTRESMRVAIAMLIVFFPTYLVLTRLSNQNRRHEAKGEYTTLAKWLVYLSLLAGGAAILADLVTVIIYFLNGEITTRFVLKALAVLLVVGSAFTYYVLDAKGYFKQREKQSVYAGLVALAVVIVAVVCGFKNIETPAEVREMKLDTQQITDLQDIQWRVEEYYRVESMLPDSLDLVLGTSDITAPTGRAAYQYNVVDEIMYELCADFAYPSRRDSLRSVVSPLITKDNYNWDHEAGEQCFTRVIITETVIR